MNIIIWIRFNEKQLEMIIKWYMENKYQSFEKSQATYRCSKAPKTKVN